MLEGAYPERLNLDLLGQYALLTAGIRIRNIFISVKIRGLVLKIVNVNALICECIMISL